MSTLYQQTNPFSITSYFLVSFLSICCSFIAITLLQDLNLSLFQPFCPSLPINHSLCCPFAHHYCRLLFLFTLPHLLLLRDNTSLCLFSVLSFSVPLSCQPFIQMSICAPRLSPVLSICSSFLPVTLLQDLNSSFINLSLTHTLVSKPFIQLSYSAPRLSLVVSICSFFLPITLLQDLNSSPFQTFSRYSLSFRTIHSAVPLCTTTTACSFHSFTLCFFILPRLSASFS